MRDQDKTKEQLIAELVELRQQAAALEASLADHQREAELLQQTEARWRSAVVNAPTFIAIVDRNGTIQFLNHAQPGMSVEDAIGRTTYDFVHPKYHNVVRKHLQQVFQTGETQCFESVGAGPNGQDAWYETYLGQVEMGGQVVAATMTAIDITDRKRAEEALRHERNRAQEYLDVAAVIMVVLDSEGKITLLNQKGYEILGYQEADLFGQHWFGTCVPERMRNEVVATFRKLMAGQLEPVEYYENPVVTRSGEERIIAWHNALLTDDTGQIVGTLSSGTDITERRQAEEALQKAHDELEEKVKERTFELANTNDQLAIFQRFAEAAGQGFAMADLDNHITYANPAILTLMGCQSLDQFVDRSLLPLHSEHAQQRIREVVIPTIIRDC